MTDIDTGSYTVIAQTAAETMGVPLEKVVVRLRDSSFPVSCGSGGQWGGNNATGVRVRDYPITLDKLIDHQPDVV
jgi:xanthine dehydrogenase YagR molybdenum-binding subunit